MSSYNVPVYDEYLSSSQPNSENIINNKPSRDMYDAKLEILIRNHSGKEKDLIIKAFNDAKNYHGETKRKNGELYFSHPVAVALILNEMKADYQTICAALLHDVVEDCKVSKEKILDDFGSIIANLVDSVTKVSSTHDENKEIKNIKTINKLSVYMATDIRAVYIKLADRLHNMRTIDGHDSYEAQARIAKQTLDIYVPLAALLGMYQIKEELEDLSFKVLDKNKYNHIYGLRKNFLSSSSELSNGLFSLQYNYDKNDNSFFKLYERVNEERKVFNESNDSLKLPIFPLCDVKRSDKGVYGINRRFEMNGFTDVSQVRDLITYSIVLDTDQDSLLYDSMSVVNSVYDLIPVDPIIDYVTKPKTPLYRCIITSNLFSTKHDKMRIRVRHQTSDMYLLSIYGLAAFWNYDDMTQVKKMQLFVQSMPFYNDLLSIINEYEHEDYTYDEFYYRLNQIIFPRRIYVTVNDIDFVETIDGISLEEFIMSQNNGYIDLNMDYYVNGNLVNLGDIKKRKKGSQSIIIHNNDSIKTVVKGEKVERNLFGGIIRGRKK